MNNQMFTDVFLETDRLIIRPLSSDDTMQLRQVVAQEEVMRFLPEDVMSLEDVQEIIDWLQTCYRQNTPEKIKKWTLAVVWKESSEVIGWCGLGPLDFNPAEIEIFYGLAKDYRGRGLATEAARAVMDYGFDSIGLDRIVAVADPDNIASVRVLEKLGMKFERRLDDLPEEFKDYNGFFIMLKLDRHGLGLGAC